MTDLKNCPVHIGQKFERLIIVRLSGRDKKGSRLWECLCSCGNTSYVSTNALTSKHTRSCGCLQKETVKISSLKHGLCVKNKESPLYNVWENMKQRCFNYKCKHFLYYGGRGITVCDEWKTNFKEFHNWALANGWKEGLTIDRIDVDGNYEPLNCQWITLTDQQYNKRNSNRILYKGKILRLKEVYDLMKAVVPFTTFSNRYLKLGWTVEKSAHVPIHRRK